VAVGAVRRSAAAGFPGGGTDLGLGAAAGAAIGSAAVVASFVVSVTAGTTMWRTCMDGAAASRRSLPGAVPARPSKNRCTASTAAVAASAARRRDGRGGGKESGSGFSAAGGTPQYCHPAPRAPLSRFRMKLATLKDGSRDGQLAVVSRDLSRAHFATGIAGTMQRLLDDWNFLSPQLEDLYATLNDGKARHAFDFEPRQCMAPLPRACQWVDGSAYLNHVELVRKARGAEMPASFLEDPLMYQGGSDDFLGPTDDAVFASTDWGIDFESELAVVTGDVPIGATPAAALETVRLLMLVNDWSLRHLIPAELARGFGFLQSKPATAFGPVAATPDELGDAWQGGRVHLALESRWNGRRVGLTEAGSEMSFHFGQLIAHVAKTRRLRAGSIVGSGTVSNKDWSHGWSCIAEQRAIETIESGAPKTAFMQFGDTIRIEMLGHDGQSVFGAIDQRVAPLAA